MRFASLALVALLCGAATMAVYRRAGGLDSAGRTLKRLVAHLVEFRLFASEPVSDLARAARGHPGERAALSGYGEAGVAFGSADGVASGAARFHFRTRASAARPARNRHRALRAPARRGGCGLRARGAPGDRGRDSAGTSHRAARDLLARAAARRRAERRHAQVARWRVYEIDRRRSRGRMALAVSRRDRCSRSWCIPRSAGFRPETSIGSR